MEDKLSELGKSIIEKVRRKIPSLYDKKKSVDEILEEVDRCERESPQTLVEACGSSEELSDLKETIHFYRSCCYNEDDDFAKAEEHYQALLQLKIERSAPREDVIESVHGFSLLYEENGRLEEAIDVYHQHLTDEELNSEAAIPLADLCKRVGELEEEAKEIYRAVI